MRHDVPVVALSAGAVPDTVGHAAVLVERDAATPHAVAASVHEMLEDDAFRASLVAAGRGVLASHSLDAAKDAFVGAIRTHLARRTGACRPLAPLPNLPPSVVLWTTGCRRFDGTPNLRTERKR